MNWKDKFSFIEDSVEWNCYEIQMQGDQWVYKLKNPAMEGYRFLIGIPKKANSRSGSWYKFFVKGDRQSYHDNTPLEELPKEVYEMVVTSMKIVEEQSQLRKLFI